MHHSIIERQQMFTCRLLNKKELGLYGEYLKKRDRDSLTRYFGTLVSDQVIDNLVSGMIEHEDLHDVLVAENENLEIVGTIHIARINDRQVELGIMVSEAYRGMGVANEMMEMALLYCRNRGLYDVYMHCMSNNEAIMKLVKKKGLFISNQTGEADAHVTLPYSSIFTLVWENLVRSQDYAYRLTNERMLTFKKVLNAQ